jgi:MoaA/NifB/PqqE/SkfB family radical SAM enzyme
MEIQQLVPKGTIKIANFLLTRRCNLRCSYCRISGDVNYLTKPSDYPDAKYYHHTEKDIDWWINLAKELIAQNPDIFFILYGGEPLLKSGLYRLVSFLNDAGSYYTIISNCSDDTESARKTLFSNVEVVKGFTASIDPIIMDANRADNNDHEYLKSIYGLKVLKDLFKDKLITDPVAEVTCDNETIHHVVPLVKMLSDEGICTDITVLDIAKNNYYDFSSVTNPNNLVQQSGKIRDIFDCLINSNYNIHMKQTLLPLIFNALPSDLDCGLDTNLHNITVDSDGKMRLCLRIRGRFACAVDALELFDTGHPNYIGASNDFCERIAGDKAVLCDGCNWTCVIMSQLESQGIINH